MIPVKNVAPWISAAIHSIEDVPGYETEIIVVDDGSSDGTLDVISKINDRRLRIFKNSGSGVAAARNTGLDKASGQVLFALDGDDQFAAGGRTALMRALVATSGVAGVVGACRFIDEDGRRLTQGVTKSGQRLVSEDLRAGRFYHLSQFALWTDVVREVGWNRVFFQRSEDADFLFRIAEAHEILYVPAVVSELRVRSTSISRNTSVEMQAWYGAQARKFQRQRIETGVDDLMAGRLPPVPKFTTQRVRESGHFATRMILAEAWHMISEGRTTEVWRAIILILMRSDLRRNAGFDIIKLIIISVLTQMGMRRAPRA